MNAASVRRSPGVSSVAAAANIIYRKLLKSRANIHVTLFRCKTLFDIVFESAHGRWSTITTLKVLNPALWKDRVRDPFAPLCFPEIRYISCTVSNNFYCALDAAKVSFKAQQKRKETKMILFRWKFAFWNFSHTGISFTDKKKDCSWTERKIGQTISPYSKEIVQREYKKGAWAFHLKSFA